jgi:hypothetical protein
MSDTKYTKMEVISWFSALQDTYNLDENNKKFNNHVDSFVRNGESLVNSWTKLYAECMLDIGIDIGKDSNTYKETFKSKFKEISGVPDDTKWNLMTKKEFIQLFAQTIAAIDRDTQQRNKDIDRDTQQRNKAIDDAQKEQDAEELAAYNRKGDMFKTSGSRKTARKRIRRRRSSHRRRASTRKHKK